MTMAHFSDPSRRGTGSSVESSAVRRLKVESVPEPPGATWSNCLVVGDEIILSGVTAHPARDQDGNLLSTEAQVECVLRRIEAMVVAAGGDLGHVLKLVVYLTDMRDKTVVNEVRRRWFDEPFPASTLVGVNALVFPELTVEIDAIARLRQRR